MKSLYFSLITGFLILFNACSSIQVTTDYDTKTDFSQYKTFAFYRPGIDKASISNLDKKRILKAISAELKNKGLQKSENPDVLISIFTKAREKVDIYESTWYPSYYYPYQRQHVSKYTEGTLFIDMIDKEGKKLIWQGIGKGFLSKSKKVEKRKANIQKFVQEILAEYPPVK